MCDKSSNWMTSPSILQYIFVHKKARPLEGCGFQRNNSIVEENSGECYIFTEYIRKLRDWKLAYHTEYNEEKI